MSLGEQVASLRLLSASRLADRTYRAGIEIVMKPGSHTYWKQPGEAGVPPVFAFNGSTNVASATVLFPQPARLSEEGIEAFGYMDRVVFPVAVVPADAGKPVTLTADVTYAVCNKICIPAHGKATLELTPDGAGVDPAAVTSALAEVPAPIGAAQSALAVTPQPGAPKPTWTIAWSGTPPVTDVFADAPEGFYFQTKQLGPNRFSLIADQVVQPTDPGKAGTDKVKVSLTLAREKGGLVATQTLDLPAASR